MPDRDVTAREPLTDEQLAMLEFERVWWRHPGAKDAAIRATFGVGATRYYQRLHQLLDDPRSLAAPTAVHRLRRLRERRQRQRLLPPRR